MIQYTLAKFYQVTFSCHKLSYAVAAFSHSSFQRKRDSGYCEKCSAIIFIYGCVRKLFSALAACEIIRPLSRCQAHIICVWD